jgi:copper chaperone
LEWWRCPGVGNWHASRKNSHSLKKEKIAELPELPEMTETTFKVESISCGHCTSAIQKELSAAEGVSSVTADAETKLVKVRCQLPSVRRACDRRVLQVTYSEPATAASLKALLVKIDFEDALEVQ